MFSDMGAPKIPESTREERERYIKEHYKCINDCDMCGICAVFHNQDPMLVFRDYIDGKRAYAEIAAEYR